MEFCKLLNFPWLSRQYLWVVPCVIQLSMVSNLKIARKLIVVRSAKAFPINFPLIFESSWILNCMEHGRVLSLVLWSYSAWMVTKHFVRDLRYVKWGTTLFMTDLCVAWIASVHCFRFKWPLRKFEKLVVTRAGRLEEWALIKKKKKRT